MSNFTIQAVDESKDTITVRFGIDKSVQTFHGLTLLSPEEVLAYIAQTAKEYATSTVAIIEPLSSLVGKTFTPEEVLPEVVEDAPQVEA